MSKKSNLAFIGIGSVIAISVILIFGFYLQMEKYNDQYFNMKNDGMSPAISEGEVIKYDRNYPFSSIIKGDIIAFLPDGDSEVIIAQRVVEIIEDEPRQVITQADSVLQSIQANSYVTEEEYIGKIVQIFPDNDSAFKDIEGRYP